jgi:lipoprotein-releasing system permease protein
MGFEWFVARRYLSSPDRPAILRLVTLFSILGVAAGVATLVIALAMNSGFREALQERLLGVSAHVSLTEPGAGGIHDYAALAEKLEAIPGVRSVTPAVYQTMLLTFGGQARGIVTKAIDVERERKGDIALQHLAAGELDFSGDKDGVEGILVGKQLADEWKMRPGDFVTLLSPQGRLTPFGLMPRTKRFRLAGIFDSGFYDYDENWSFIGLGAGQALSGAGDIVNVLELRIEKPEKAGEVARAAEQVAGASFRATTWMEENRALFRALRLEKLVCSGAEYSGGAVDDGDGPGAGHCGAAGDGCAANTDSRNILAARDCDRGKRYGAGISGGLCVRVVGGALSLDSAGSRSVCGAVRAVSP